MKFKIGDRVQVKEGRSTCSIKYANKIGIITGAWLTRGSHYLLDIDRQGGGIWENELILVDSKGSPTKLPPL